MAFARGRYQSGVLRGPQWRRQAPLNGITMAGAEAKGVHVNASTLRSALGRS